MMMTQSTNAAEPLVSCVDPVACSIETLLNSFVISIQGSFDLPTLVFA